MLALLLNYLLFHQAQRKVEVERAHSTAPQKPSTRFKSQQFFSSSTSSNRSSQCKRPSPQQNWRAQWRAELLVLDSLRAHACRTSSPQRHHTKKSSSSLNTCAVHNQMQSISSSGANDCSRAVEREPSKTTKVTRDSLECKKEKTIIDSRRSASGGSSGAAIVKRWGSGATNAGYHQQSTFENNNSH